MKKLMLLKLVLFFPLLLMTYSALATIGGPVRSNWLNPMSGAPENFEDTHTYVFLDQDGYLNINLILTTTDDNMELYDPLFIGYSFGTSPNHNGHTNQVVQGDFVEIEPGIFQAVYSRLFNYEKECELSSSGILPTDISIRLETTKFGGFDNYPMEQNLGLFNPSLYDDYYSEYTTSKYLVCWGVDPPSISSNEDPNAVVEDAGMTLNQPLDNTTEIKVKNEKVLQATTAYPNPFYSTFSLNYVLENPSAVQIRILDTSGKVIAIKNKTEQPAGTQQVEFRFENDIPPGLYTALISYSGKIEAIKLIKLKALK